MNRFFAKKEKTSPFAVSKSRHAEGKWAPGWEIFYEEDLYVTDEVIHSFSTKLMIEQKMPGTKNEDKDEELTRGLFEVMALEDSIPSNDPVCMIQDAPGGKGKERE